MIAQKPEATPDLAKVLAGIRSGRAAPCYLLFGAEEFLVQSALESLLDALLSPEERDLNLFRVDGEAEDPARIAASLMTAPLIPGRKVVLATGTHLLQSKRTLPDLERNVREHVERNPALAVRDFLQLIHLAGWVLEDLADDGWKKIPAEEWNRTIGGEGGADREKWLPRILDACFTHGRGAVQGAEETEPLEAALRGRFFHPLYPKEVLCLNMC